jgi:hypothetical protein
MPKVFGEDAARVTTQEMKDVFTELQGKVGNKFAGFELTLTLEEKNSHGDIDILVLLHPDQNPRLEINSLKPLKVRKNDYCYSFLYPSEAINKTVHVDFLVSSDPNLHHTKKQYYAFNELSNLIGRVASTLGFKYGSKGFFKRYEDKRGNWHDLLISVNLNPGLQILGYEPKPLWIRTYDDIVNYVSSSLLFSSSMFSLGKKRNTKRTKAEEIGKRLREMEKKAVLEDPDYFFKRMFKDIYEEIENKKKEIEDRAYLQTCFNGTWLIEKFGMTPGPQIGKMLVAITEEFGDLLGEIDEEIVTAFVRAQLDVQ